MSYLKQETLRQTQENPISLSESIEAGTQDDLSMKMVRDDRTEGTAGISEKAIKAIKKLLGLADNPNCPLELREKDGERVLVLETIYSKETILFSDEVEAINCSLKSNLLHLD